jgi:endoglycosylceramidase
LRREDFPRRATNLDAMGKRVAAIALGALTLAVLLLPAAYAARSPALGRSAFGTDAARSPALGRSAFGAHATTAPALPWLTVSHPAGGRPQLVDPDGRTVLLRGVNAVGIEDDYYEAADGKEPGTTPVWPIATSGYDGACPAMNHDAGEPPLCEVQAGLPEYQQSSGPDSHNDFAQMRALGFDFVRLPISWSQLEPERGVYSQAYLDRIAQVVEWAGQQGIYVLLDMHQDAYSRFIPDTAPVDANPLVGPVAESSAHADGAPPWAVITDNVPSEAVAGTAEFNLAVETAFTNFWVDTDQLQEQYIGAMAAVTNRFKGDPTVVGYEIMNEPLPGLIAPGVFSSAYLYPFYAKVIAALTGAGKVTRQSFFFEPMAIRNLEDAPDQLALPFTTYPNIVYAPHTYTHVFTVDAEAGIPANESPYPLSYNQAFEVANLEADDMHAALISGEFGNAAGDDATILRQETAAQDTAMVGSALWAWKGSCTEGSSSTACSDIWAVYAGDPATPPAQNGALIPSRVTYISRVYPRATAGTLESFGYDPTAKTFSMTATDDRVGAPTVIFIPADVPGNVAVSGAARLSTVTTNPDGTRLAEVAPTGRGAYSVKVG